MNTKRFLIVALVLVVALAISAFSWIAVTRSNGSQRASTGNLTSLNADQISAYRWEAMAGFYESQLYAMRSRSYKGYLAPVTGDSTALDAALTINADPSADYYQRHTELSNPSVEKVVDFSGSDWYQRHRTELGSSRSLDTTDYYVRHPELRSLLVGNTQVTVPVIYGPPGR